jgi:hypothetical protein
MDSFSCNDEGGMVVLESNWVGIVAPIVEIV